jgi:hypothetical protein
VTFFFIPQNMVTFAVFLCSLGVGEGAEGFDDNTLSLAFSLQWQKENF